MCVYGFIFHENIYSSDATFVPKYEFSGVAIVDDYDNDSEVYHILFTDAWLPPDDNCEF